MLPVVLAAGLLAGAGSASCGCASTFDKVVEATETHYAGYLVTLPGEESRARYRRFTELLRDDARDADGLAECRDLLHAYLAFFDDAHLYVSTATPDTEPGEVAPRSSSVDAAPRAAAAPDIPNLATRWTPDKVEFRLRRENNLDPVEGLWRDDEGELAIVSDDAITGGRYIAFRFSYRYGTRPGEMLALIKPIGGGAYDVHYKTATGAWQRVRGLLNSETGVLAFGATGWQRTTEPASEMHRELDPFAEEAATNDEQAVEEDVSGDPLAPELHELADDIYYLGLPSFAPRFATALDTLLAEHADALANADGLVIDLRGNAGGDEIYLGLLDYLLTGPIRRSEASAVRASSWNIEILEQRREALGEKGGYLDAVIARMQANPGEIVPYRDALTYTPTRAGGPQAVVVLQDRGTGAEAESFLLRVMQSGKVVTMGEASRGNIDYRDVVARTLGCGDYAIDFNYPLVMRSRNLPADALDAGGITPDLRLSPVHGDWTDYAVRWLGDR